jgi:hypothetical protein
MGAEYERLRREADEAREALNATRWWQLHKREKAATRYRRALLRGAFYEIDHPEEKESSDGHRG